MASFLVESYAPRLGADGLELIVTRARAAAESLGGSDGRVRHVRSYLVPGDEMGFHVVEADSAEDVVRVARLAKIEVERIVEAIGVGPGGADDDPSEGAG